MPVEGEVISRDCGNRGFFLFLSRHPNFTQGEETKTLGTLEYLSKRNKQVFPSLKAYCTRLSAFLGYENYCQ